MFKFTYSWSNVRDVDPQVRINHEFVTFAENEQDAEIYVKEKTQEWMNDFNSRTSATTKGHVEDIKLISTEEVKKIEANKIDE
jgi:hypothetical protein